MPISLSSGGGAGSGGSHRSRGRNPARRSTHGRRRWRGGGSGGSSTGSTSRQADAPRPKRLKTNHRTLGVTGDDEGAPRRSPAMATAAVPAGSTAHRFTPISRLMATVWSFPPAARSAPPSTVPFVPLPPHSKPSSAPSSLVHAPSAAPPAVDAATVLDAVPLASFAPCTQSSLPLPFTPHVTSTASPPSPVRAMTAAPSAVHSATVTDAVPLASFAPRTQSSRHPPFAPHLTSAASPPSHVRATTAAPSAVDTATAAGAVPPASLATGTQRSLQPPPATYPSSRKLANSVVAKIVDGVASASTSFATLTATKEARDAPITLAGSARDLSFWSGPPAASSVVDAAAAAASAAHASAAPATTGLPQRSATGTAYAGDESPPASAPGEAAADVAATRVPPAAALHPRATPTTGTVAAAAQGKSPLSCLHSEPSAVATQTRALSAAHAAAAPAPTGGAPTTTTGASGARQEEPRSRVRTAESVAGAAAAAAAAAHFSSAVAARPPLSTLRGAPIAGPHDRGALANALVAAGALSRPAPAMSKAQAAAGTDDKDAKDIEETLGEALSTGGCGWVLMGDAIPNEWVAFVRRGARRMSSRKAQSIINSQLHELMEELGDAADIGRRQVPVPTGGGGRGGRQRAHFSRQVRLALATVAARVGNALDVAYDGVTPHVLITMPRTPAQLAHTHTGLYVEEGGSGATLLSGYVSFEEAPLLMCGLAPLAALRTGLRLL